MELFGIIYKTTNLINNKIYIGQDSHNTPKYLGSGLNIIKSIKKYGKENFQKITLEECDRELLNDREQYWIAYYDSMNPEIGYNLTSGGNQAFEMSNETKLKMSQSRIGILKTDSTRKKMSDAKLGNHHSVNTISKIILSKIGHGIGKIVSVATKNKISNSKIGILKSESTKQKMHKPKVLVKCIHCNKIGGTGSMQRWHFDNCKNNIHNEKI